jgi:hypothetical protein
MEDDLRTIEPPVDVDNWLIWEETANAHYRYRCSDPETEHARVTYLREFGNKILRRLPRDGALKCKRAFSLPRDPYERLEYIERV